MSVDRVPQNRYFSGKDQQQRSAREKLKFILANKKYLLKVRNGSKLAYDAEDISKQKHDFTEGQLSYIDGIYEKVWKGYGEESAGVKHDIKKVLRY
jgi:hypothetical protein